MVSLRHARVAVAAAAFELLASAGVYAQPAADSFNPGANGPVIAIDVQTDGKVVIAGGFTMVGGGGTGTTPRNRIARLNADGSIDPGFNPGADADVLAVAIQSDGKILVGGDFTHLGGGSGTIPRRHIGRLNADGSVDAGFDPGAANGTSPVGASVRIIAVQRDGKILVGGRFSALGGGTGTTPRQWIGRLNVNGSVDEAFPQGAYPCSTIEIGVGQAGLTGIALQADGKIVVVGYRVAETPAPNITFPEDCVARLNTNGSVDPSLSPPHQRMLALGVGLQSDGGILVARYDRGTMRSTLARYGADGSPTPTFTADIGGEVSELVELPNRQILIGGRFSDVDGVVRVNLARLNADGSLDTSFAAVAGDAGLSAIELQADGKILVGGSFRTLGRAGDARSARNFIGRLDPTVSQIANRTPGDFDGDGKTDVTVVRPSNGTWYQRLSGAGGPVGVAWGSAGDLPVPGDYDGDGWTDAAVFRPSDGVWYVRYTGTGTTAGFQWGNDGDVPVAGDYNGDGTTDVAVFRPANGTWYVWYSGTSIARGFQWGSATDAPLPADYDGDGMTDLAVFRPANGGWYVSFMRTGATFGSQWGNGEDTPVPGDYDADGKADIAVFRPSNGTWYVLQSHSGYTTAVGYQWGNGADTPIVGDYDGDGVTDITVFRPSDGTWYILKSTTNFTAAVGYQWGNAADIPLPRHPWSPAR